MCQGGSREEGAQGAPGRVRAAAEPGDGRVERAHGRVERSTTVRDAYAVRVVELLSLAKGRNKYNRVRCPVRGG
jgi:hypothetical protein